MRWHQKHRHSLAHLLQCPIRNQGDARQEGHHLGSDQAIRTMFHYERATKSCFQTLDGPFLGQNGRYKKPEAPSAHGSLDSI